MEKLKDIKNWLIGILALSQLLSLFIIGEGVIIRKWSNEILVIADKHQVNAMQVIAGMKTGNKLEARGELKTANDILQALGYTAWKPENNGY